MTWRHLLALSFSTTLLATAKWELRVTAQSQPGSPRPRLQKAADFGDCLLRHTGTVNAVAFSPDNRWLASGGSDGRLRTWNCKDGRPGIDIASSGRAILALAWSPDGRRVAAGCSENSVRVFDIATGRQVVKFTGHEFPARGVAYSMDGSLLYSCGGDRTIRVWQVNTGKEVSRFEGHTDAVFSVTLSADGSRLLSAGADKTARLWDTSSGRNIMTFSGHGHAVYGTAWVHGERNIVTVAGDHSIRLWDARTADCISSFSPLDGPILYFGAQLESFVAADTSGAIVFDTWSRVAEAVPRRIPWLASAESTLSCVALSPNAEMLAIGTTTGPIAIVEAGSLQLTVSAYGHTSSIVDAAHGTGDRLFVIDADGSAANWNMATRQIRSAAKLRRPAIALAGHADRTIVAISADGRATRLDCETLQGESHVELGENIASACSHDGRSPVLCIGQSGTLYDFDAADFSWRKTGVDLPPGARLLSISREGQFVAVTVGDSTIQIFDLKSKSRLATIELTGQRPSGAAFSPDAKRIYIGTRSGRLEVRILDTPVPVCSKQVCRDAIVSLKATSLPGYLVAGTEAGNLVLLDANSGFIADFAEETGARIVKIVSDEGLTRFIVGRSDGTLSAWSVVPPAK
jgi:WD40 repeat protein